MDQHTLLPWRVGTNGESAKGHAIYAGSRVIAKVYGLGYPAGRGWHPRSAADAAFIVQAVNSHDALVKALEGLVTTITPASRVGPWESLLMRGFGEGPASRVGPFESLLMRGFGEGTASMPATVSMPAMTAARAALALARKKEGNA